MVRVREVADPKCRCAGVSRPRWICVTPRGALPDPRPRALWRPSWRRCGAGGTARRRSAASGSASLRPWSCRRRACAGSRPGRGCRGGSGWSAAMWIMWFIRRFPARERRWRTISPEEASMGAVPVQDANRLRSVNRATSPVSARVRAATTGPTPGSSISVEPEARTISLSSLVRALIFFSTAISSAICSAASRRAGLAGHVAGPHRRQDGLGLAGGDVLLATVPERVRPAAGAAGWLPGPGSCSARRAGRPATAAPRARAS